MRRKIFYKIILISIILFSGCNKDDDKEDCLKNENFFEAQYKGAVIEPYYISGLDMGGYTFGGNNSSNDINDWNISAGIENPDIHIFLNILDINGTGTYIMEGATLDDNVHGFSKTFIGISDINASDPDINNGSPIIYLSKEGTGTFEITEYDPSYGIVVGTFNCVLYNTQIEGDVIMFKGKFNLNKSELGFKERPCWL